MEILYALLVMLLVTRLFGAVSERLGQPALVGEVLAGVALGLVIRPFGDALPVLSGLTHHEAFAAITDLGLFLLMLLAGQELHPRELARASGSAAWVALGGVLLPLALGLALGFVALPDAGPRTGRALFLGVALSITAVPVSVRVLMDLGRLDTGFGRLIVSAALIDDVLGLVLLAVLTAVIDTGSFPGPMGLFSLGARVSAYFVFVYVVGRHVLPRVGAWIARSDVEELELSFLLVAALGLAVLAEAIGMHFIIGAFGAALFFGRSTISESVYFDVKKKVTGISAGFFAPVFFGSIGLHLDLAAFGRAPWFALALIVLAMLGKLLGTTPPARASGLGWRDAVAVGVAMNARGAVELVIAGVALRAGLFEGEGQESPVVQSVFSSVVVMAIVTTLATPLVLQRILLRASPGSGGDPSSA